MSQNNFASLVAFFSKGSEPVTRGEFLDFWLSMSLDDQVRFRNASLDEEVAEGLTKGEHLLNKKFDAIVELVKGAMMKQDMATHLGASASTTPYAEEAARRIMELG